MIVICLLVGALLFIFGGLLGHTLSQRLLERELRRKAALSRDIGERWRELQAELARRDRHSCPHCERSVAAERAARLRVLA